MQDPEDGALVVLLHSLGGLSSRLALMRQIDRLLYIAYPFAGAGCCGTCCDKTVPESVAGM
jgi:hypothetical protein